jgi:hypothetical protein
MDAVDRANAVVDDRLQRLHDVAVPVEAGTQYAAVSALRVHVVPCASRLASEERAFVEVLPKNSCGCDAPGSPGRTIGSSGAKWLRRQTLKKFVPCDAGGLDAEPALAASSSPPATIVVRSIMRPSFHCDANYQEDESEPSGL